MRNAGETQESRRETLAYGQQICILAIGATARARAVLAIPNGSNQVEAAPLVAKSRVKSSPAAGPGSFPITVRYMPAISFSTRSSTDRNGSLHRTVRCA